MIEVILLILGFGGIIWMGLSMKKTHEGYHKQFVDMKKTITKQTAEDLYKIMRHN